MTGYTIYKVKDGGFIVREGDRGDGSLREILFATRFIEEALEYLRRKMDGIE